MPLNDPITAPQAETLRRLATTHTVWPEHNYEQTTTKMNLMLDLGITKNAASALIDQAYRSPRHRAEEIPASEHQVARVRAAAAEYAIYGLTVSVDETIARTEATITAGHFTAAAAQELIRAGMRAAPHPTAQTPLRLSDIEGIEDLDVSEGHYAVFDNTDTLRFYRIYTPATGANQGEGVIRRFAGDNLLGLYPDEARTVLHAIDADPDAAAYRFSDTFTRCWVCGKNLTDSVSRLLSVGPTCRGFANHAGLRTSANEVDHNPERRQVYRAIREWALSNGFTDPRTREDRTATTMSASRVASAWSGIPGVLGLPPDEAIAVVTAAQGANPLPATIRDGLLSAPKDTILILIASGVLSTTLIEVLIEHPNKAVSEAASTHFLSLLGM